MAQCKPLEMESIVPAKRRLSATKWQRTWNLQFQDRIVSAQSLYVFTDDYFEGKGFELLVKVKSLKAATFVLEFEQIKQEDEIEIMFNFLILLDSQFLKIKRVEDRIFNQWNIDTLLQK